MKSEYTESTYRCPGYSAIGERSVRLSVGEPSDDGSFGEIWRFTGERGDGVQMDVHSQDFDTMLVLRYGAPFGEQIGLDDDGGSGLDAKLQGCLPRTGPYYMTVTSSGSGVQEGKYDLALRDC